MIKNIAVFASGTGSNFLAINEAIKDGKLEANLKILISDKPYCKAVENAKILGIEVFSFKPKDYCSREAYELEIVNQLKKQNINLIVMAGYMRLVGKTLLNNYEKRIINIHPSLLPLYKGIDAIGQALENNAIETGVSVHYVDEGMDTGKVIDQRKLSILNNETREHLEQRIHEVEHELYPIVIKKVLERL